MTSRTPCRSASEKSATRISCIGVPLVPASFGTCRRADLDAAQRRQNCCAVHHLALPPRIGHHPPAQIINTKRARKRMSKPSGFSYGWVVVGAGALMTCVGFGSMLSLAVFLQPISEAMGWSRSGVSAAATIDFPLHGAGGVLLGRAVRPVRHPHRRAVRQRAARRRPGRGEPGHQPVAVPADVRRADRRLRPAVSMRR